MRLHVSSTVVLIIRRSKLCYTASDIITPVGGRPVNRLRESSCARDGHLQLWCYQMLYNTILTSRWWAQQCSKHVEAYNKLIIKTIICVLLWLVTKIILRCTVSKTSKVIYKFFFSLLYTSAGAWWFVFRPKHVARSTISMVEATVVPDVAVPSIMVAYTR